MIKICFPKGCYGTYFARCIYNYTNLRNRPFSKFDFSHNGSSHQHRNDSHARSVIREGHLETLSLNDDDQVIAIVPCVSRWLDYYNNHFFKQQHGQLINHVLTLMSLEEAEHKLQTHWNYNGKFDASTPRWILREWCSFWIADVLDITYNTIQYHELNSVFQLTTQDIFENWPGTLTQAISLLGLTINIDIDTVIQQHTEFLSMQKFHNSQNVCQQYVNDVLEGHDNKIILNSVFDEAYIQYLLRQQKFEIKCDGLNSFPTTTRHLKTLIYETSNNHNP